MKKEEKTKTLREKKEGLKEITPSIWNSFQHMYDTRANNSQNQVNFLLIVVSFLPIFSFMLFEHFNNISFLFPVLIQFTALIILLKSFFIHKKWPLVNWLPIKENLKDQDNILKHISDDEFYERLISSLKALEAVTWNFLKEMKFIIRCSASLLLLSLYGILIAGVSEYFNLNLIFYLVVFILGILPVIVIIFYQKQPNLTEIYDKNEEKTYKILNNWLEK